MLNGVYELSYRALELLFFGVRKPMVLVVALLVESFTAILTDERFDSLVDPHVSVQGRRPVKGLATRATNVRFLRSVNDLVAT